MAEYESLWIGGSPPPIVIQNFAPRFESPGGNWLALNPRVGFALGWHPAGEGLFRWVDSDGRTTVESEWWTSGVRGHPWHAGLESSAGDGWAVLASPSAAESIVRSLGNVQSLLIVQRLAAINSEQALYRSLGGVPAEWP